MIFNVCNANHEETSRKAIEDIAVILSGQLRDLGHRAIRTGGFFPSPVYNIMFEHFFPEVLADMTDYRDKGYKFIIVGTEAPEPDGKRFYGKEDLSGRRARMFCFEQACRMSDAVWPLLPDTLPWYKTKHANVSAIEFGYSPSLMRLDREEPDMDFAVFGVHTQYRIDMYTRLAKAAKTMAPPIPDETFFATQHERDQTIWRAKTVLNIKQQPEWPVISGSRCATALSCGRPVFSEFIDINSLYRGVIDFAPMGEDFVEAALRFLPGWQEAYERQLAAFKTLDAERCLGAAVRSLAT